METKIMLNEPMIISDLAKCLNESNEPQKLVKGENRLNESVSPKSKQGMEWIDMVDEMEELGYDYTGGLVLLSRKPSCDYSFTPEGYNKKQNFYQFKYNNKPGTEKLTLKDLKKRFKNRATIYVARSEYAPEMTKILMTNKIFEAPKFGASADKVKIVFDSTVNGEIAKCCEKNDKLFSMLDWREDGQNMVAYVNTNQKDEVEEELKKCGFTEKNGDFFFSINESSDCGSDGSGIKIEICTENDAFAEDRGYELARILREVADKVESGNFNFKIRDINGNVIGLVKSEKINESADDGGDHSVLDEFLSKHGMKFEDIYSIYSGKDHYCRCGCGGKYHEASDKSFDRIVKNVENVLSKGKYTKIVGVPASNGNVNISMENNKAYTIYFE